MSTLKVNSIEPANAGSEDFYLSRAWVNFNGTGTVSIRADGNVSSITDNGTGIYTVNFSSGMPSASYSAGGATGYTSGTAGDANIRADYVLSNSFRYRNKGYGNNGRDEPYQSVQVLR